MKIFFYFREFIPNKKRRKMEKSRSCDVCIIDVHQASYAKHLRNKQHLGNIRQDEITIPEWLFTEEQEFIKNEI